MHVVDRPAAAVGDRHVEGLRQVADLDGFGVTRTPHRVRLNEVDGMIADQLAETPAARNVLAGRDWHLGRGAQLAHVPGINRIHRFLEPGDVAFLDRVAEFFAECGSVM